MAVDISTLTNSTDFLTPFQVKQIIFDYKTNVKPPVYPQGVTVNLSKNSATEGDIVTATATITPVGYEEKRIKSIKWSATDGVNINPNDGTITARTAGTATITCTVTYKPVSMDDNETRTITGTAQLSIEPATIYADYITVSLNKYSCTQGDTAQATATVYPENASSRSVTWRSSNTNVAGINANTGAITTYNPGSVYFTATATDGSGKTANTNNLSVAAKVISVSSISVSLSPSSVETGNSSRASATVYPSNATNRNVTWSSGTTSVATINSSTGAISTYRAGSTTIRATANDGSGKYGTATLYVSDPAPSYIDVTSISATMSTSRASVGDTVYAYATVYPSNATDTFVSWSSSDDSIASINYSTGVITCKKPGSVQFKASSRGGSVWDWTVSLVISQPSGSANFYAQSSNITAQYWTAPANVTRVTIFMCGGGGGGGSRSQNGGGGSSGGYRVFTNVAVTPGRSYTVYVGRGGGVAQDGGDSVVYTDSDNHKAPGGKAGGPNYAGGAAVGYGSQEGGIYTGSYNSIITSVNTIHNDYARGGDQGGGGYPGLVQFQW